MWQVNRVSALLDKANLRKLCSHRAVQAVALLVLLYTVTGFLLLPWSLRYFLMHTWAEQIQHDVQLRTLSFNPFLLKLQVDGLQVQDSDNTALVSFEQLRLDYAALSLFRFEFGVEEFALDNPYLKLEADGQGGFTLMHLFAARGNDEKLQTENSAAPLPAILLQQVKVNNGMLDYRDAQRAGGIRQIIDVPLFTIDDFHSLKAGHANRIALELRDRDAGIFKLDTTVALQPLQASGKLALENFNLAPVWQWLNMPVNFHLQSPHLEIQTQFDLQVPQALDLRLSGGSLILRDLAFSSKTQPDAPLIKLPLLAFRDARMDLQQQALEVGVVEADDGWLDVVIDKQGVVNLQSLFNVAPDTNTSLPAASTSAANPDKHWNILIHQFSISNYKVQLRDEKPSVPFTAVLAPLSVVIQEWKPLEEAPFTLHLKTGIADGSIQNGDIPQQLAQVALDARLQRKPLLADAHVDVQNLPLSMLQPYVHDFARVDINTGFAAAALDVHVAGDDMAQMQVDGVAQLRALDVHERGTERKLLSWELVDVAGLSYRQQDNSVHIGKILLDKLNTGFIINADGTTNVGDLLVASGEKPMQANSPESTTHPLQLDIGVVDIRDADIGFSDLSMKPDFHVAMQQLSGDISGLSTDPATRASIDLIGKVDRYAPVTIKGKFNPLAAKPSLDAHMAFKNLELTTFTPYSGTYAGFKINKGQLSLDIDYQLVDNRMQGKNRIVMNQLQLGESVKSNKAVDLPLKLAIALLRDDKGVIDLGFEVSGDMNDPQFSVAGIVWKVLGNMVKKIVTSPFKALSAILGGAEVEAPDQIAFVAGSEGIEPAFLGHLQLVADMLDKRSGLHLDIQGNSLAAEDKPAMQKLQLLSVLQANNKIPADVFLSSQLALDNGDAYKIVANYYKKQRNDEIGDVIDRIKAESKTRGEKLERKTLQRRAYEQVWQRLQDDMVVPDNALHQLAMRRALRIKDMMVEKYHVAPQRLFVQEANADPAKASLVTYLVLDAD